MNAGHWIVLSGGVGGARFASGMVQAIDGATLTIVGNTGDDFEHLGLSISPDLDTLLYTLAGIADPGKGWGIADDTWNCMAALDRLGGPTWFRLGDRDLATHLERTQLLNSGESLSGVTARLSRRLGLTCELLPMSDQPVRTVLHTDAGTLSFQEYFVQQRAAPRVSRIDYVGATDARASAGLLQALARPDLAGILIAPSNPWLSVDPILAIPEIRAALERSAAPVVAISPLVAGRAVKGPTTKLMAELGLEVCASSIARHYASVADGFILDAGDHTESDAIRALGLAVLVAPTLMADPDQRRALAHRATGFARTLGHDH